MSDPTGDPPQHHPAYGVVETLATYGAASFFGTPSRPGMYITLKFYEGAVERRGPDTVTRVRSHQPVFTVRLTHFQFAEMVANRGQSPGVPCTIESIAGERMPPLPPQMQPSTAFKDAVEERVTALQGLLDEVSDGVDALLQKKRAGVRDLDDLQCLVNRVSGEIHSNIPYLVQQINEAIEKLLSRAKVEMSAHMAALPPTVKQDNETILEIES